MMVRSRLRAMLLPAMLALAAAAPAAAAPTVAAPGAVPTAPTRAKAHHPAVADATGPAGAASAWFLRACVRFATHPKALGHWAAGKTLVKLPDKLAQTYLFGLPGTVFAIPTRAATHPLILVAQDSGSCSVIAGDVRGKALLDRLDAALTADHVTFTVTQDGPDPKAKDLHDRAYTARKGKTRWLMLVSTVTAPAGGEAILTSAP